MSASLSSAWSVRASALAAVLLVGTAASGQYPLVPPVLPAGATEESSTPAPLAEVPRTAPTGAPPKADPPKDAPVVGTSALDRLKMSARWNTPNPGVWIETADKDFVLHVGGTVHYDLALYGASSSLELGPGGTRKFRDGANLRRGRVLFEGTLYQTVDYKFEFEIANGIGFSPVGTTNEAVVGSVTNAPGPTDAWVTIKNVPWIGNIRIGNQKEWFSLEALNSHKALEFLERSYLFDFSQMTAYNNGRSPGISVFRTWANDRVFTGAGVYKNDSVLLGFGVGDGEYAFTGRVGALPVWAPDEKVFWYVGGAMSHRDPVGGQVQIRIRDNVRNAPFPLLNLIANTGLIDAKSQDLYNLQTAAVWGPLTFQAEYTANVINGARVGTGPNQGSIFFEGLYAETMLFLTGESRTWNPKTAVFNRVQPLRPLRLKPGADCEGNGLGAWELALRYTYLDLQNKAIRSGRLDAVTLGLNWYLNTSAKLQFNYDWTQRGETPARGHVHGFGTRMAFDF